MRGLTLVLIITWWPAVGLPYVPDKPDFAGILEIRSPTGGYGAERFEPPVVLRDGATSTALSLGEMVSIDTAETFEWNYESIGIAVYGYIHDGESPWYKIYVPKIDKYAWIAGRDGFGFRGLSQLVANSLPYLTSNWDRAVYADPSSLDTASVLAVSEDKVPIEIASTARVEGRLWLLVVVLEESPCISAEAPPVLGAGWVPALSEKRLLNVWFYSRGC